MKIATSETAAVAATQIPIIASQVEMFIVVGVTEGGHVWLVEHS